MVALRKESVDRNTSKNKNTMQVPVALRKESVDRNAPCTVTNTDRRSGSLSARRAWIEIGNSGTQAEPQKVALRKESVDRNA